MGVTDHGTAGAGNPLSGPSLAEWAAAVSAALDDDDTTVDARIAAAQAAAEATAAGALASHEADTTAVHGIADTANLETIGHAAKRGTHELVGDAARVFDLFERVDFSVNDVGVCDK